MLAQRRHALCFTLIAVVLAVPTGCGGGEENSEAERITSVQTPEGEPEGAPAGDPEAGAAVFASAGCGGCHTLEAAGSGGTTGPNLDEAGPAFEKVVDRVTNGGVGMPSFGGQLSAQEIGDVAAYVAESTGS